ncbi:MAG: polysaccharide deacetylase family protein [Erysipelotrichaceae bacterium]
MIKKRKKHLKKSVVIVLGVLAGLLILSIFYFFMMKKEDPYLKFHGYQKDNKEIGKIIHYESKDKDYFEAYHYPKFKEAPLDTKIKSYINKLKETKKKADYIYTLDYESHKVFDSYLSLLFTKKDYDEKHKLKSEEQFTMNYDLKHKKLLQIEDIFRSNYKFQFADLFKNGNPMFLLQTSGIRFYDQKQVTDMNYNELKSWMALKNPNIPSIGSNVVAVDAMADIDPNRAMVAFTFDDGPNSNTTNQVLDAFGRVRGSATFFMLGSRAINNPDIVKRIVREGHEIGNHSMSHANLSKGDATLINNEFFQTQNVLYEMTGHEPTVFRPPYGAISDLMKSIIPLPMTLWSIDTLDWKTRDTQAIVSSVMSRVHDGSIILLHDIYGTSASAIDILLPKLQEQGYQFVTIDELNQYRPK